ncbi:MAG: cohesin domain-containing protein, partial [Bryobacterales bacterium]|nr:cohesin domain-containing protein [Bryobacterales bacterium]
VVPAPAAPAQPVPAAPQPVPVAPAVRISLKPSEVVVAQGATFVVQVELENVQALFSAPFRVRFDPQLLRLNEVQPGGLLSGDGKQVNFSRSIMNDTGDAVVNLNRMPGSGGISGSGTLAVLTFEAVGRGATTVTFPGLLLRNYQLQPIAVEPPQLSVTIR